MDEIKTWRTHSAKHKVTFILIIDGVSFSYDEGNGIIFTAPEWYIEKLKDRLTNAYGCSVKPIINVVKE